MKKLFTHYRILGYIILGFSLFYSPLSGISQQEAEKVLKPYGKRRASGGISTKSLYGKVMCGYQGWFAAKGDGSNCGWRHYGIKERNPHPTEITIDLWPDTSEFTNGEKYKTHFKLKNGGPAYLFSSYNKRTVFRHFEWMKEYGIDGVFLQRFGVSLKSPKILNHRNVVTMNVSAAANKYGRVWAMMYDLSGMKSGELRSVVMRDWKVLNDRMRMRKDPSYLHHNGKPVVAVWGVGFNSRHEEDISSYTLRECRELLHFLKRDPKYGNNTVMLGVPTGWRELENDAVDDPLLHRVIGEADIISPWTVGRYRTPEQAISHANGKAKEDMEWLKQKKKDYLPVIFPGFSWHNMMKKKGEEAALDAIPRLDGKFLWSQAVSHIKNRQKMLYVAMFDEVDEGTAIFKCTNNTPRGKFTHYKRNPPDHYLWLTGKITEALRKKKTSMSLPRRSKRR